MSTTTNSRRWRMPATVNAAGAVVADARHAQSRPFSFSERDTPAQRAHILTQLAAHLQEVTEASGSDRHASAITFQGVPCAAGGGLIALAHGLGRLARWFVVDWTPAVDGNVWSITRSASDSAQQTKDTLYLRSYVAGTATIEVF